MLVAETILSLQGHLRDYPVRYSQGRTQGSAFNSKPLKVQLLMASLLRTHKSPHFNSIYLFCAVQLFVGIVESKVLPFRFVSSLDRGNSHNILWKLHQFNSQSLKRKKKGLWVYARFPHFIPLNQVISATFILHPRKRIGAKFSLGKTSHSDLTGM